jgi:Pentapeptide repeats (9 copies)
VDRVTFGAVDTVRAPFKCRNCHFRRGIDAPDVVFERIVDLSGSRFDAAANFQGATFHGPALFASAPRPAEFKGPAQFRLALFDDLATFENATVSDRADFSLARFRAEASFAETTFKADARFGGANLAAPTIFSGTEFKRHADFKRSSIGTADFRRAAFDSMPEFGDATFRGPVTFGQTHFNLGVSFDATQFTRGAAFQGTKFKGRGNNLAADFGNVGASGDLDFSFARFEMARPKGRRKKPAAPTNTPSALFDSLISSATVTFTGATFANGHPISMNDIKAKDLRMTIAETARLSGQRQRVLKIMESGAKAREDLVAANDADYELHVLKSSRYHGLRRLFDVVVYRWIAGYFVRPLRPLIALVVLAFLAGLVRVVFVRGPAPPVRRGYVRPILAGGRGLGRLLNEFFDALSRVVPRRSRNGDDRPLLVVRLEAVAYRLLLACALVGLANSNPTLRQLVDALK